ncbi:hypothetical protein [Oricola sp.]|uniref:hypothetical protein n=1 Tax=Oricola sp. TaxID=1979950 RepID=UPI0025D6A4BB|nr:hypothetical protein [Oricola sp.]MCI5076089.1 hypothetical protein [Oricola sp.]
MTKTVVLLTIHGMGEGDTATGEISSDDDITYPNDMIEAMERTFEERWQKVEIVKIYYQGFLQPNELDYYRKTQRKMSWHPLRKLAINGIADAGSLEYSRATEGGPYYLTQGHIMEKLGAAHDNVGGSSPPVVVLAHSLGCEVISNYIWDANKETKTYGFWEKAERESPQGPRLEFQKLTTLKAMITTGCNIPMFIAGLRPEERVPIDKPTDDFTWDNYYDKDDVLGYPLEALSEDYGKLVTDHAIRVGNLFTGWNPFSHNEYWKSRTIRNALADQLEHYI